MTLPGFRWKLALLMLSVMVALTGCGANTPPDMRPWRIVASDAQGAIVVDGVQIRSFHRGSSTPVWTAEGNLNGVACVDNCTTAYLTFADRKGLFLAQSGSITRQNLPTIDGTVRVLLARAGSVVLVQATDHMPHLLLWHSGTLSPLRKLDGGSTIWHGTPTSGTLFMLGEKTATAVTIRFNVKAVEHHLLPRLPHGLICYSASKTGTASLPEDVFRTLQKSLGGVSTCLKGPDHRWIGVSNYLAMSPDNPNGRPSVSLAVADPTGTQSWKRTFSGERFDLSPGNGSQLLVANGHGMEILDTLTGRPLAHIDEVADAEYTTSHEIVTINFQGEVRWIAR